MKIGLLLYPSCLPAGLLTGLDFFRAANLLAGKPIFNVKLVGIDSAPVICGHDQRLIPEITIEKFNPDAIVLPGFWADSPLQTKEVLFQNKKLQFYLNTLSAKKSLWSYCTGVFFHAQTGRLKGKRATATWWLAQDLIKGFPEVQWQVHQTCILNPLDITSSGANGFYSIFEEILKKHAHKKVLSDVQKYLMSPPLLEQNDPFYQLDMIPRSAPLLSRVIRLVEKNPAYELSLNFMAAELGVSTKTLARHLKQEVPWTPAHFFRMIKFKQAGELLITTELSISEVCAKLGFDDESNFSRSFKTSVQLTPAQYRQKFKKIRR